MKRQWANEGGYTLVLRIREQGSSVTLYQGEEVVYRRLYEWFERWRAVKETTVLAAFGHMREVASHVQEG